MGRLTDEQREEIARILEIVSKDGLPGPRDLDAALDAIQAALADPDERYYETVRPKIIAFSKDFGRQAALLVVGRFRHRDTGEPCGKGADVAEADWPALLKELGEARALLEVFNG